MSSIKYRVVNNTKAFTSCMSRDQVRGAIITSFPELLRLRSCSSNVSRSLGRVCGRNVAMKARQ